MGTPPCLPARVAGAGTNGVCLRANQKQCQASQVEKLSAEPTAGTGSHTGGYRNQTEFCGCLESLQEDDVSSAVVSTAEVVLDL